LSAQVKDFDRQPCLGFSHSTPSLANVATGQVEPDSGHSHLQPPSAFLNSFPAEIRTLPLHRLDLPISA